MINIKWKTKKSYSGVTFPLDVLYTRNIKLLFGIQIAEYIRVVTYPGCTNKRFTYLRRVFTSKSPWTHSAYVVLKDKDPRWKTEITRTLNLLLHKDIEANEILETKYIKKYPFLLKNFVELERERKLKLLGI
jgi:hypothetical protein